MMEANNTFDVLEGHSLNYIKMALGWNQLEIPDQPDGYGKNIGDCGDTVEIFLTVQDDYILSTAFDINGCVNTRAAANTVVMLTEGRTIKEAWGITPDHVINYLETLPSESEHCAELAVGALYKALVNYQEAKRNPWKKIYQTR